MVAITQSKNVSKQKKTLKASDNCNLLSLKKIFVKADNIQALKENVSREWFDKHLYL